jgi:mono/diheme cytochrome c family protein
MIRLLMAVFGMILLLLSANVMAGDPLEGRAIYNDHCAGCHGANGRGVVAGTPNLAGPGSIQIMVKPDAKLMDTITYGKGIMPGFQGKLSDKEMRDVIAHIRTFF